jgi:hypothetical protein
MSSGRQFTSGITATHYFQVEDDRQSLETTYYHLRVHGGGANSPGSSRTVHDSSTASTILITYRYHNTDYTNTNGPTNAVKELVIHINLIIVGPNCHSISYYREINIHYGQYNLNFSKLLKYE